MANQQTTTSGPTNAQNGTVPLCTKCSERPRAAGDGNNPWCKECRAEYQRDYEQRRLAMKEKHGYALGVKDMRELLAAEFDRLGFSQFSAIEVRDLILRALGPKLPD